MQKKQQKQTEKHPPKKKKNLKKSDYKFALSKSRKIVPVSTKKVTENF
jgi:hypothetical protein